MAQSSGRTVESKYPPGLYIVATPIGNAGDITLRALELLQMADMVACEDTRTTAKLFGMHGIHAPLCAYHEHNAEEARPRIFAALAEGKRVALVSDAGTPLISDPGYKLVRAAVAEGFAVTSLPGACSAIVALTLAGLPTDRFFFAGFLPAKTTARKKELAELAAIPATLVFLEATQRLPESLADMAEVLGERQGAIARELTKLYEETRRGTLAELAGYYAEAGAPKGEAVIVVAPPEKAATLLSDDEVEAALREALARMGPSDAAREVAALSGRPRGEIYKLALGIKNDGAR